MEMILRAAATYVFVLVLTRVAGKRTLGEVTSFDFVLLLIISETVQSALGGSDGSMTGAFLLVLTLIMLDVGLSVIKQKVPLVNKIIEGTPLYLIHDGKFVRRSLEKERVDEGDILHAARQLRGVTKIEKIRDAVLEPSGGITVITK